MKITIEYEGRQTSLESFLARDFDKPISNSLLLMFVNSTKEKLYSVLEQNNIEELSVKIVLDSFGISRMEIMPVEKDMQDQIMDEFRQYA